jgi:hypothetical protein
MIILQMDESILKYHLLSEPIKNYWKKINNDTYINLDGNENEISWHGISSGYSWCRGSDIIINTNYGYLGKTKKNILSCYHPLLNKYNDNCEYNYDDYTNFNNIKVTNPKEFADFLKNETKKISNGCYFIDFQYENERYFIYLYPNISMDDLICELINIHNFAESNGKKLLWI